jgi:hypothetical protein
VKFTQSCEQRSNLRETGLHSRSRLETVFKVASIDIRLLTVKQPQFALVLAAVMLAHTSAMAAPAHCYHRGAFI